MSSNVRQFPSSTHAGLRQKILDAAIDEIGFAGLGMFSLGPVAARSKTSTQVITELFVDRHSLLVATGNHVANTLLDAIYDRLKSCGNDPMAQLLVVVRAHFDIDVCPPHHVAVWSNFLNAQSNEIELREIFDRADEKLFKMICDCVSAICERESRAIAPEDIANGIFGAIDRHWLDRLHLIKDDEYADHYQRAADSVESLVSELFGDDFAPHQLANTPGKRRGRAYRPDPTRYPQDAKMFLDLLDKTELDKLTPSALARHMNIETDELINNERSWDDIRLDACRIVCEEEDIFDIHSIQIAGADPKAQIEGLCLTPRNLTFTRRRALWWNRSALEEGLRQTFSRIEATTDRFFESNLSDCLESLCEQHQLEVDVAKLCHGILTIKRQAWLRVNNHTTPEQFTRIAQNDLVDCRELLVRTLPGVFGASDSVNIEATEGVPDRHQVFSGVAKALQYKEFLQLSYVDIAVHCNFDDSRIREMFPSVREAVVAAFDHYNDAFNQRCVRLIRDKSLSAAEKLYKLMYLPFDRKVVPESEVFLWKRIWAHARTDALMGNIVTASTESTIDYIDTVLIELLPNERESSRRSLGATVYAAIRHRLDSHVEDVSNEEYRLETLGMIWSFLQRLFPNEYNVEAPWPESMADFDPTVLEFPSASDYPGISRDYVVSKGVKLLNEHGLLRCSLSDIASEDGLPISAVTAVIPSDSRLHRFILEHCIGKLWSSTTDAIQRAGNDPKHQLLAMADEQLDWISNNHELSIAWLSLYGLTTSDPGMWRANREYDDLFIDKSSELMAQLKGVQSDFNTNIAAVGLEMTLQRLWDDAAAMDDGDDLAIHLQSSKAMIRAYLNNLFPGQFRH